MPIAFQFIFLHNVDSHLRRGVAQSGSAPALGAGCRGFESLRPDHVSTVVEPPVAQLDRASAF